MGIEIYQVSSLKRKYLLLSPSQTMAEDMQYWDLLPPFLLLPKQQLGVLHIHPQASQACSMTAVAPLVCKPPTVLQAEYIVEHPFLIPLCGRLTYK